MGYAQNAATDEPRPLVVEDTKLGSVDFRLLRAAVIVATVTDEFGEAVAGAIVNVFKASSAGATRKLIHANANGGLATTDDRGEVRLYNLPPGPYYVSARRSPISPLSASRKTSEVFYPGTLSVVDAKPVDVAVGQEAMAHFALVDVRLARVTGSIVTSTGAPYQDGKLQFLSTSAAGIATQPISMSGNGRFVAADVPPGTYRVQVRPGSDTNPEYVNEDILVAGDDITDIVLAASPPASITGRITFDPKVQRPKPGSNGLRVDTKFTGSTVAPGRVSLAADWTFTVSNILGKGRFVIEDRTNTWFLDGAFVDGQDVTDVQLDFKALNGKSIELRVTRSPTVIAGTVVDAKGESLTNYAIVAFSADARHWYELSRYIATARPDQYGRFTVMALPAGDYYVVALDRLETGEEFSIDFLEQVRAASTRASIEKGVTKSLRLSRSISPR
jgi:protocatechuate 3,4-dioxygenase beta subunit